MKIAILSLGGFARGGTEKIVPCLLWLVEQLIDAGHEVHVFVPMQEAKADTWPLLGATVHNAGKGFWRLRLSRWIGREHAKAPFDILHAFWIEMGVVAALAGKALNVPIVLTLPGGDVVSLPEIGYGAMSSFRGRATFRVAARSAALVTVPSNYMRLLAAAAGIDAITVILGADSRRMPPTPPRGRDRSKPLKLLHVANLSKVKDQPTLLRALGLLKARGVLFEVRVIGFDTLGGQIQRMAGELGLAEQVRFLGELPFDELRAHYQWADLLVMASRHEAGPLVMLEAALCGVPTVGTRVGHIADQSQIAALAVSPCDPVGLADAIEALDLDDSRRMSMAHAAQAFAVENDAALTARTMIGFYRKIGVQRPRAPHTLASRQRKGAT